MFQASINGMIVAKGETMDALRADFAHEVREGRLDFTIDDCDVVEYLVDAEQAEDAYQSAPVRSSAEGFLNHNRDGITEDALRKFCEDGYTEDSDLTELVGALESAGANAAAKIARGFIGL
jgi:hypothetical protein